jgi:acetyl esterase/lipase
MTPTFHPVVPQDRATMATIREMAAPAKGVLERAAFDAVIEHTAPAQGVTYEAGTVGGVAGWWCRPPDPTPASAILYLHGGAYILGTAKAYRNVVGQIALRVQRAAFIPDYALAPEQPFPAAVKDAEAVYAGLHGQGFGDVVLVGDSAGGGLALILTSLMVTAHGKLHKGRQAISPPTRAAAMSPWTDLALTGATIETRSDADPFLTRAALASAAHQYLGTQDPRVPTASPLYGTLGGLPPIRVDVGEDEILLDDARRYAEGVASADGQVQLHIWEGMPHVFPANVGVLQAADVALDHIASFLRGAEPPRTSGDAA